MTIKQSTVSLQDFMASPTNLARQLAAYLPETLVRRILYEGLPEPGRPFSLNAATLFSDIEKTLPEYEKTFAHVRKEVYDYTFGPTPNPQDLKDEVFSSISLFNKSELPV